MLDPAPLHRSLARLSTAVAGALLLSGCQQTGPSPVAETPPPKLSAVAGVSPHGAPVAVVALDGGPGDTAQRFSQYFTDAAQANDVVTSAPARAPYLLRGYLTATPSGELVRLTAVSDLFDRRKTRLQRMTDEIVVPRRGPDPWTSMDDTILAALATRSAQSLAAVLTNTAEAQAATRGAPSPARPAPVARAGTTEVARETATPALAQTVPASGIADAR